MRLVLLFQTRKKHGRRFGFVEELGQVATHFAPSGVLVGFADERVTFCRSSGSCRRVVPEPGFAGSDRPDAQEFRPERWFGMSDRVESPVGVYGNPYDHAWNFDEVIEYWSSIRSALRIRSPEVLAASAGVAED